MDHLVDYIYMSEYIAPAFSALACAVLILFSYGNIYSRQERYIKRITLLYMFASFFSWGATFLYIFFPRVFVHIHALNLLSLLYVQVLFYHLFHILTCEQREESFSWWHYAVPAILTGILIVWSLFVPYEIKLEIVVGKGKVLPAGYELYTRFFTAKMLQRMLYCIVYMTLVFIRLSKYYKTINRSSALVRKPAGWVFLLASLAVASIVVSVVAASMRAGGLYLSAFALAASVAIISQHIVLTYHIIGRQYMLYIAIPRQEKVMPQADAESLNSEDDVITSEQSEESGEPVVHSPSKPRKAYTRKDKPLSRHSFDAYMKKHKPYLDLDFKITDLMEALDSNRSYISGFVNKTYGVNFNRYVNRLRLAELERLLTLAANEKKSARDLFRKAGFSDYKHYTRAVRAEQSEPDLKNREE